MTSDVEEIPPPAPTPTPNAPGPHAKKRRVVLRVPTGQATSNQDGVSEPNSVSGTPVSSQSAVPVSTPSADNTQRPPSTTAPAPSHKEPARVAPTAPIRSSNKPHIPDFRLNLKGRAKENNAADSAHFKNNKALVFNFLCIEDAKEDDWTFQKTGKGSGSTGNMNTHMETKHGGIWAEAKREQKRSLGITLDEDGQPSIASMLSSSFNLDTLHEKIVRWITISNQPFTEIESEELLEIFSYLRSAVEGRIIKADALKNRIKEASEVQRQSFKEFLQSIPGLMPIALDAWTSSNRVAFLAIVGSFITEDWILEEVLLDFVEMHGAHDGKNMANCLNGKVTELGLLSKIIALAADNASNNGTLVSEFSKIVGSVASSSGIEVRWDGSKGQIRCLPHVIHLAVMALLLGVKAIPANTEDTEFDSELMSEEEAGRLSLENNTEAFLNNKEAEVDSLVDLGSAIAKLRKICRIVRSSPQRMEHFKKIVLEIETDLFNEAKEQGKSYAPKKPLNLLLDAIDALCDHAAVKVYSPYRLSKEEWNYVAMITSWLKFFKRASTLMSGDKYVTLSSSLAVYATLMGHVSKLLNGPEAQTSPALQNGLQACYQKLEKFFDKATFDTEYYYFAMSAYSPLLRVSDMR
ncbi:hypothetical protein FRC01_014904 [Tulasnella sp. 417]|nr:hypothetical protein FRC01_014904 [Tulasnella sp. 417]